MVIFEIEVHTYKLYEGFKSNRDKAGDGNEGACRR